MKVLIIRLSSLGDVVLASASLSALPASYHEVHWLTSYEYGVLLQGHPRVNRVWEFDRKKRGFAGFRAWFQLCHQLWNEDFDQVFDLHSTLRSRLARVYFCFHQLTSSKNRRARTQWKRIGKSRWRLWGFFALKKRWPRRFHPEPWVNRFSKIAGGTGSQTERPNLQHLAPPDEKNLLLKKLGLNDCVYFTVMPGALWEGKRWPVQKFKDLIQARSNSLPVILGTSADRECQMLCDELTRAGIPHLSGVGKWNLREVACVLSGARCYVGNDTGLAHLSEAMGTPSVMIFGPTVPEMGFGPWKEKSVSCGSDLWCRPCGKDGRFCFRWKNRYACLTRLPANQVIQTLERENLSQ